MKTVRGVLCTYILLMTMLIMSAETGWLFAASGSDDTSGQNGVDLTTLSIEQLMNMNVTSVTKGKQSLSQSASAIFVLTSEDIRRSGVTSIPEALRIVPGIQVARIDSNKWAITSRGFNKLFSNKLLVLIDGRSVYTSLFSGVYWDVQDTLLEDLDRIEVIRGPGASVWGANAVNGVINIITKEAEETQGILMTAGVGDEDKGIVGARYGGNIGENAHYRFYTKYFNRDDFVSSSGNRANDEWDFLRGGFRLDWEVSDKNQFTFQGDIYRGDSDQIVTASDHAFDNLSDKQETAGGNFLTRWTHTYSDTSDMTAQLYYDRTERDEESLEQHHDTIDFDFFHHFVLGERQKITWGSGYRFIGDDIEDKISGIRIDTEGRRAHIFSLFVQDEITLVPEKLTMTLGSKLEQNSYTGFEHQPSGRLMWTPNERHSVWMAVARAVRTPSRFENDGNINIAIRTGGGSVISNKIFGGRNFESENLLAYELGYRVLPSDRLSIDIAAFYNTYNDLQTSETRNSSVIFGFPPTIESSIFFDNKMSAETYGVEIAANYQVTDWWKASVGYSYLQMELDKDSSSNDGIAEIAEDRNTNHQFKFRSNIDLPYNFEFDTSMYYVENLFIGAVPSYIRLDTRLGWHLNDDLEVSISARNLLDPEHPEFPGDNGVTASEVERNIFGQITWRH